MAIVGHGVTYEFGPFRIDSVERLLARDGSPVPLAPKVAETLLVLVERAGHLVTKEELLAKVWPDTFVDESNLSQNVFRLRRVLGGDSDAVYIETVPRRGYRFVHPVRQVTAQQPAPARRIAPRAVFATLAAAAVVVTAARFGATHAERPRAPLPPLPALEKITTDSRDWDPAISPDGRFVAYAVLEGEEKSIWMKNLAGGGAVRVMPPTGHDYRGLRFSPDGRDLFYKTFRPGADSGVIERVPSFGGAPLEVASGVWSDFALSPDGRQVAFVRGTARANQNMLLVVAGISGGGERFVARNTSDRDWFDLWDVAPTWSADGQHIALCGGMHGASGDRDVVFDVRLADGARRAMQTPSWSSIEQVAWIDRSALAVVARDGTSKPAQIWIVDQPSGSARRITNDLTDYAKLTVTADGRTIAVEQRTSPIHLCVVPEGVTERARQLTFGANDQDGRYGLAWTPAGRILFVSNRTGEYEIWSMKPDGSEARQITVASAGSNRTPRPTPDGRFIVFASSRTGKSHIWRIDSDGANPVQLTDGHSQLQPDLSPDGRWVYYTDPDAAPAVVERVSIDGGAPQRVSRGDAAAAAPAISRDGSLVAYHRFSEAGETFAVTTVDGGPTRMLDLPAERGMARWTPDGRALAYASNGSVNNVWAQPLDGGAARPLTRFTQEHIWNFAVASDGKTLAVSRGSGLSDIVLLSRFR
jgi:Tol biopolymer transport system component/DNA-binding winged helix-turn-helix (wHTH) protein